MPLNGGISDDIRLQKGTVSMLYASGSLFLFSVKGENVTQYLEVALRKTFADNPSTAGAVPLPLHRGGFVRQSSILYVLHIGGRRGQRRMK